MGIVVTRVNLKAVTMIRDYMIGETAVDLVTGKPRKIT
jgi:hypothetical protein